jgi:uncharacterized protein (DUF488 family)
MAPTTEILTVGHSNHEEREFLDLLDGAGVELVVDVRASPHSRFQHFNRSSIAGSLATRGIGYEHLGEQLGGRRLPREDSTNDAWEDEFFRGYADHMESEGFGEGLARLRELAAERRVAVLCAEADWADCHRRLIADALVAGGDRVAHLGPHAELEEHELYEAAVVTEGRVSYPRPQTSLDL